MHASTLPSATALELLDKLDEAYAESHLLWQNVLSGSEPAMQDQPRPAPRHHLSWPLWRPRGLALALPVPQHLFLSLSAQFLPLWCPLLCVFLAPCLAAMTCAGFAAQLTALAELEDSVAVGISRVLGSAGTASAGATASPVVSSTSLRELSSHEAATALPRAAATTTASSRARSRSRSPAPLPKRAPRRSSSTVSVARGSFALAESGLVTGLAVKSCPPAPPTQLRLSHVSRALAAASGTPRRSGEAPEAPAPAQASEASRVPDLASDSDSDWDAFLDAHGLAPPPNVAAAAVALPADAAGAGRRARDKRRRRLRKAAKRSMWRYI